MPITDVITRSLEVTRQLLDEALAANESRAAATLLRLSNSLESTASTLRDTYEKYLEIGWMHRRLSELMGAFIHVAEHHLSASDLDTLRHAITSAMPKPLGDDESLAQLNRELEQTETLFKLAIAAKMVNDASRLGHLIAAKIRLILRREIEVGRLVPADESRGVYSPVTKATSVARELMDDDSPLDDAIDEWLRNTAEECDA